MRPKGEAAWWNPRGFGFIKPMDGGEDNFCHVSVITDGNVLREGDMVECEQEYDDPRANIGPSTSLEDGGRKNAVTSAEKAAAVRRRGLPQWSTLQSTRRLRRARVF
jgi:cold shock CspA family protein